MGRIEKLIVPTGALKLKPLKKKPEEIPTGPQFPSRAELLQMGPYPIEKAMALLSAHAYYLWGETRHLQHISVGTPVHDYANVVERFAKRAQQAGHNMVFNAHIPQTVAMPNFPISVAAAPAWLLLPSTAFLQFAGDMLPTYFDGCVSGR